jgi:hypothetical protein
VASASLSEQRNVDMISEPTITSGEPMAVNELPGEILLKILSYLGPDDLVNIIPKVCKRWKRLSTDVTLWKTLSYHCDDTTHIYRVVQVRCAELLGFRSNVNLRIMAEVSRK